MRKVLAWFLVLSMVTLAGCMGGGGGGGGPQQAPEPSGEEVEKAVKKALHDEDLKDVLRREARMATGVEVLEQAIDTQEGREAVTKAVKQTLNSTIGRAAMQEQITKLMEDPQFKAAVQMAIKETLVEMLSKGAQGGKDEKKKEGGKEEKGDKKKEGGGE